MLGHHPNWSDIPDLHFYCQNIAGNSNDRINVTVNDKDASVYINGVKSGIMTSSNAVYDRVPDAFGKNTITIIYVGITEGDDWILAVNAGQWYYSKKHPPIYKCLEPSL